VPPTLLAVMLAAALLTLIPARRMHVAGWSSATTAGWYAALWLLSVLVLAVPGRTRFLVPVILAAWILPFVLPKAVVDRFVRRRSQGRAARPIPPSERDATH
jgi:hypothetical protein